MGDLRPMIQCSASLSHFRPTFTSGDVIHNELHYFDLNFISSSLEAHWKIPTGNWDIQEKLEWLQKAAAFAAPALFDGCSTVKVI